MPKKKNLQTEIERLLKDFSFKEVQSQLNKHQPLKSGRPKIREENALLVYIQIEAMRKPGESVRAVCERLERYGGIGWGGGDEREHHSGHYPNAEGLRKLHSEGKQMFDASEDNLKQRVESMVEDIKKTFQP
jgi:hypothetical protein